MRRIPAFASTVLAAALCAASCSADRPAGTTTDQGGTMDLTSDAFEHEGAIPARYTCDGEDLSPPLSITGIPDGTASLALVVDDPDAPRGVWDHWVVSDIPTPGGPSPTLIIPAGQAPPGTPGANSWGRTGYGGPCPPSGTHRYFFVVYALDIRPGLPPGASKADLLDAAEGHVLAEATLMGRYGR